MPQNISLSVWYPPPLHVSKSMLPVAWVSKVGNGDVEGHVPPLAILWPLHWWSRLVKKIVVSHIAYCTFVYRNDHIVLIMADFGIEVRVRVRIGVVSVKTSDTKPNPSQTAAFL